MFHLAAHGHAWEPLYADATEASRLWEQVRNGLDGLVACCVMPDHLHVIHPTDARESLRRVMRAYARFRNHHRGTDGPVWAPAADPQPIAAGKLAIQVRYVHLNPCRARLVTDPLAWPLSTHRDAVGLTFGPARKVERSPWEFHAYVSGDPSVHPAGTGLPVEGSGTLSPGRVAEVVAGLARVPVAALHGRSLERAVWLGAVRELCGLGTAVLARQADVGERTVQRAPPADDPRVRLVCRVVRDERFRSLESLVHDSRRGHLRSEPW